MTSDVKLRPTEKEPRSYAAPNSLQRMVPPWIWTPSWSHCTCSSTTGGSSSTLRARPKPVVLPCSAIRKSSPWLSLRRSASKTEWVYGFKVALVVDPEGVITVFGLAPASSDERPIGEALVARDRHEAYLADKGFTGVEWERRWLEEYGAIVAATPYDNSRRAWPKTDPRWASGKRQIIGGGICQLKDFFGL